MIDENTRHMENQYLMKVTDEIGRQLLKARRVAQGFKSDMIEAQLAMKDYINPNPYDLDDIANIWQYQVDIDLLGKKYTHTKSESSKLEKMLASPYFGRIDFREDGERQIEKIYIGISGLFDPETREQYVYDWRAPVSGMFYDFENGRAFYSCPAGLIEGELLLKRQYRISKGQMEFMFDNSLKIDDDILQEVLAGNADSRMKSIVTTIQREQNRIIRDEKHDLLMVSGPAGSGKTSIALHRIAYLLYRYRKSITARNILIFSPNSIFSDYISNVLPELGEENMHRLTFLEFASGALGEKVKVDSPAAQMEYILEAAGEEGYGIRVDSIRFKASAVFAELLKRYVDWLQNEYYKFEDISAGGEVLATKDELENIFKRDSAVLPLHGRLLKIRSRLLARLDPLIRTRAEELMPSLAESGEYLSKTEMKAAGILMAREEYRPVKEKIKEMTHFELFEMYLKLFKTKDLVKKLFPSPVQYDIAAIGEYTSGEIKSGEVPWEDAAPLLFLKGAAGDMKSAGTIRHVVIDEAQDYSLLQYEVLKQVFRHCSFTLLGDFNQAINPLSEALSYDSVKQILHGEGRELVIPLKRSYRSTKEITLFSRCITGNAAGEGYIERHGQKPALIRAGSEERLQRAVKNDIIDLTKSGMHSIAVICKMAEDSAKVFGYLKDIEGIKLVTARDEEYTSGVVVIPSYLAKGLEFDAVIVCRADEEAYRGENLRKLFYTVVTRALHVLHIYYIRRPAVFINDIDRELYIELEA